MAFESFIDFSTISDRRGPRLITSVFGGGGGGKSGGGSGRESGDCVSIVSISIASFTWSCYKDIKIVRLVNKSQQKAHFSR